MKTLFQSIREAGIPYTNHESDLYIKATPETRAILSRFPLNKANATGFINQAAPHKGELWLDVPFAFDPFWESKMKASHHENP